MISVCDIGSMPPKIPHNELREGARHSQSLAQYTRYGKGYESARRFEEQVTSGLIDKLRAGVDVPSYPQFRDMNEMFLDLIDGHTSTPKGYIATDRLSCSPGKMIPEVGAIRGNLKGIAEKSGVQEINLKICVTGPYTLSTLFSSRTPELIRDLGKALRELTANSLFKFRDGRTSLLSIDEPVFGFIDDPLLDHGYPGREFLREAWSCIAHAASVEGLETMIHLHSTRDDLMWEVDDLDIIGSHVGDPLYTSSSRKQLAATGKRLSVSVAETKFDDLIIKVMGTSSELGEMWTKINREQVSPESFLEGGDVISSRLHKCIELFGEENIPYAGPECGLGGFPTYECAVKYLGRISSAIKKSIKP